VEYYGRKICQITMSNFRGLFECILDDKGRFVLPRKLRQCLPKDTSDFVVMKGDLREKEKCLYLYTDKDWSSKEEPVRMLDDNIKENRDYQRRFGARIMDESMDTQNRITLPLTFIETAGLKPNEPILLYGQYSRIEIWDPETYDKYFEEIDSAKTFNEQTESIVGGAKIDG